MKRGIGTDRINAPPGSGPRCSRLVGVLIGLVLLAIPLSALGRVADEEAVEALRGMMRMWVHQYQVPAASAALMKPGLPVRKLRYGMLATDPARIASLSKAKHHLRSGDMATAFKAALATPLQRNPGGGYSYSNIGYLTLGEVVEAVTGNDYEEHCRGTALNPLHATGSIDPELRHRAPNGGWRVSAVDYVKFMQVWSPDAGVLGPISRSWLDSRIGEGQPVYGLGIRLERTPSGIRYSHGGRVAHEDRGGSYAIKFGDGLTVVALFEGEIDQKGRSALPSLIHQTFSRD